MTLRQVRLPEEFLKEIEEIQSERLKNGNDDEEKSYGRITLAIIRTGDLWGDVKKRVILGNFKQDKKAQVDNALGIILFVVLAFTMALFFGVWGYANQIMTDTFVSIGSSGNVNMTEAAENTFGAINSALIPGLRILSMVILFGMVLQIFLTNFLIRKNPLYFLLHVFMTAFAVILSVYVSNAYESFLTGQVFSSQLIGFTATTYILLNLPVWVTVIGIIGAILLVINMPRQQEFLV